MGYETGSTSTTPFKKSGTSTSRVVGGTNTGAYVVTGAGLETTGAVTGF